MAAGRSLRIGSLVEKRAPGPRPIVQVPNTGAPDASTSGSGKSPLAIHYVPPVSEYASLRPPPLLELTLPDAPLPPTSSQMVTPAKASSSALPEEEVLPEEAKEGEEEQEVALIRKRKGKMVAEEVPKRPRRVDTPALSHDSGIPPEVEEFTVSPNIVLTPVPRDEARQELRIAKYNYAMDEYSRGYAEVEAFRRVLRDLAAEAGRLSKNLINHGFVFSEFGGIDEVVKTLQDLSAERRTFQEEAARQEALAKAKFEEEAKQREAQAEPMIREEVLWRDRLEAKHQEALRAEGEAVAKARRELREAREALDEMAAKCG
ncbi:uncharacterized protein LOC133039243 [Cannabis sativa]|uniref:uncharacterized protein LOC133039243 n=1 Tax=Cannabis sativa TaxID=3483 RepID=UPI0029C9DD88|nr:uncharacterized protein LOC133039243 [Cannabis sativa]